MKAEAKLAELGLQLPTAPAPIANYVRAVRVGNLLFVSGHGPTRDGKYLFTGKLVLAIALSFLPRAARVLRSSALSIREMVYVEAARALGCSHGRIIVRHMAANVVAPYLVMLTAFLGQAILLEASLSFLGLGVSEPTPAWGLMLRGAAVDFVQRAPWLAIFPGLAISAAVLAFNVLGDSLRDALDPRLRT